MSSSLPFATLPSFVKVKPVPFKVSVSEERVELLKTLVKHAYVAPKTYESGNADFELGLSHDWLENAKKEWENSFDWREQEKRFNAFPHYKMPIGDGIDVHFLALFSEKPDAIPILFLHGWPGSFSEFLGVLKTLTEKYSPSTLPYHVIVPSLPGWGFSSKPPVDKGFNTDDAAERISKLMVNLGFPNGYVTQGGDIGSYVSRRLAHSYPECKAIHLNFSIMSEPPQGVNESKVTEEEKEGLDRANAFFARGSAYAREHATKPGTIGLVLSSSPLAFLAWVGEKFQVWSDEPHVSTTEVLTIASLYFLTDTIATSIYTYRDERKGHDRVDWKVPSGKPFGYSWFRKELAGMPVEWVQQTADDGLQWYRRHNKGGHFAALEQPEIFLEDIEDFIAKCWKK